jgi:hypothetical protein
MVFKKLFGKLTSLKRAPKVTSTKKKSTSKKVKKKNEYENRFQKFYHLNKKRLNKERRGLYTKRSKKGICVRCKKKVVKGIVFCTYHKSKQKEYNAKARAKK